MNSISKIWRYGDLVINLAEVDASVVIRTYGLSIYLKSGAIIRLEYTTTTQRNSVAKALADAVEHYQRKYQQRKYQR